jgi:hypothetical protein
MKAWSHLPNAHYIDQVIESVKENPEIWIAAWVASIDMASKEAWNAALNAAWTAALNAARKEAWNAARFAAMDAAMDAARNAARSAIAALIAWDDSIKYLDMPSDRLRVWVILSEYPAAILMLPAVIAFEKIAKKEKQLLTI